MSNTRLAIIDMGTNTFHLLVVDFIGKQWQETYRERVFVNLAEDGIGRIGSGAWLRGMHTMESFSRFIKNEGITNVRVVGTAALRNATNAGDFVDEVYKKYGVEVSVISGLQEASYICKGVIAASKPHVPSLIMDIGGGSVEFCLVDHGRSVFNGSFEVGVAVLYDTFHQSEPISVDELNKMGRFLDSRLEEVFKACIKYPEIQLIGASGSFEVVDRALHQHLSDSVYATYPVAAFLKFYEEVVALNLDERLAHEDIPPARARYIVCALYLIYYIVQKIDLETIGISSWAMKEGIAEDFAEGLD